MVCFTLFIRAKQIKIYSTVNEKWSGKPGSNWRPQPWQGCALPTELFPRRSKSLAFTQPKSRCNYHYNAS